MFTPFSSEHFISLAIGFGITGLLLIIARRGAENCTRVTALLAFLNLSAYPLSQAAWLSAPHPVPLDNSLPIHLCDLAAIIAGFALITRRPMLCALTYFWGLAATMQALITPALTMGFPTWPFFTFFIQHFAIVAAALFMPLVGGWRPELPIWKTPLRIFYITAAYQMGSLAINAILDTNYGFTMRPPDNPSLIDHLGPWPWYLLTMWPIAFIIFLMLALPLARLKRPATSFSWHHGLG